MLLLLQQKPPPWVICRESGSVNLLFWSSVDIMLADERLWRGLRAEKEAPSAEFTQERVRTAAGSHRKAELSVTRGLKENQSAP